MGSNYLFDCPETGLLLEEDPLAGCSVEVYFVGDTNLCIDQLVMDCFERFSQSWDKKGETSRG